MTSEIKVSFALKTVTFKTIFSILFVFLVLPGRRVIKEILRKPRKAQNSIEKSLFTYTY